MGQSLVKSLLGRSKSPEKAAPGEIEPTRKPPLNPDMLGYDLLFQLAHLSAVATSGVPRSKIFASTADIPASTSAYFIDIQNIATGMNIQYAEACRLVGESAKDQSMKSLLLRLANALSTGEPEADFLNEEARIQAESYGNVYEQKLEMLKKWTDAYAALIVSAALIIVVATVSTMIYDLGTAFVGGLVLAMIGISSLGAWIIYRSAPREIKTLTGVEGERSQEVPRKAFIILMPASVVMGVLFFVGGLQIGWILLLMGIILFPIGVVAGRFDYQVTRMDEDISTFMRTLGATISAIGGTTVEALGRMDLRSMDSLASSVKRLQMRLAARVVPALCWHRFVRETGSELINRSVRIFTDSMDMGGDPEEIGDRASFMTMKVKYLREKRKLVSQTFGWLTLAMHGTIVFLLIFIMEVVNGFGRLVAQAGAADTITGQAASLGTVLSFNLESMQFLQMLMIPVVIALSFINAIAAKVADGGYMHKFFYYFGLTLFASGVALVLTPVLANMIFGVADGIG